LGNDWSRWRPRVVVIEATLPCQAIPCHDRFEDVILGAGYHFAQFDGLNRYYVREEDKALLDRFATPVCVFDECISHEVMHLRKEVATGNARIDHLLDVRRRQELQVEHLTRELNHLRRGTGRRTLEAGLWVARQLQRLTQAGQRLRRLIPSRSK